MQHFDNETIVTMRAALDEVCRHIPQNSTTARTFVATRILECAKAGAVTRHHLLDAGRRAVIEQFGNIDIIRAVFR
jgi:hypothetical protein